MENAAKRSKRKDKQHQKGSLLRSMAKHRNYYIMLIPGLLAVTIFLYLPILGNFIAFKDYKIFMGPFESPWCSITLSGYLKPTSLLKFLKTH